ncbi:MAG: DUF1565 domain-containing protein, partial [Candidatus Cloacimonetes bacterium]|nr:DUF1565 domain-containing protein [Candidatus Cloacimonadota bacterium]
GGLYISNSSLQLSNVTISENYTGSTYSVWCGGGLYIDYNADVTFDPENRCSIYSNYTLTNTGNDIGIDNNINCNVILDTFTVMNPTEYHASPLANFTFDIQNGLIEPVNADLYVSPTGDNNNSGLSADEPLQNIFFALNKIIVDAENPHTIFLSDGVYSPSLTNELFPIANRDYCNIAGESRENTILDAEQTNRVIVANEVNLSIKNLTITNGITGNYLDGGGLWIDNSDVILDNLLITANTAHYYGGGLYLDGTTATLSNVAIVGNNAICAGGLYIDYNANVTFDPENLCNIYSNNSENSYGKDIYLDDISNLNVIVDTFTVMQPTAEFFYSSLSGNTIEIQNSIYEPIGADLFVSPSGSNENSGLSENEPLQTLAYALTVINSNSDNPRTIHLSEGVYSTETNENFPVFGKDFVSVIGVNPTNTIIDLGNIGRFMRINNVEQFKLENVQIINGNSYVYQHPESDDGGVIRSSNSDYDLINVTFSNNRASYGGAIYSIDSNVNIDKCNLHHNESNYSGGSIYMEGSFGSTSSLLISNSTFTSNLADGQGGAIFSEFSDVEVINTICWNNLPQELSVGSSFFDPSTLTVTNCDIMGGEANVEQYGENSTLNWLDNNIDIDPLFVDAENNNYLLQENSPCIDAGTAFFEWNDVILLDMGIEEYFGIAPDMGAFEYGMTSIEDEPELPMSNRKLTNYPNPFNPTTTISFSLTTNLHENVRIEIYNVKGQLVETLSNLPITNSPNQQIVWNANKFASGVYFYKLVVDGIAVDTKRMILLK